MKIIRNNWIVIVMLLLITIIGAALRIFKLGFNLGWIDEFWSLLAAEAPLYQLPFIDVHPPLLYILVRIAIFFLGTSMVAIRSVSALFGILGVVATYLLGKELTGKDLPGLIAAGLMAISIENIMQSQMVRMYSILPFFFCLFVIFFLRAYKQGGYKYWALTTLLAGLLMFTWYFSAILISLTLLWFVLKERRKVLENKPFLWSAIFFVIAMTFLSVAFLRAFALKTTEGSSFIYTGFAVPYQILISDFGSPPMLALFIGLIAIGGLLLLYRDNEEIGGFVGLLSIGSIAILSIFSFFVMVLPRYEDIALPLFYVLIGFALYSMLKISPSKLKSTLAMLFVLAIIIVSFIQVLPDYYTTPRNFSGDIPSQMQELANDTPHAAKVIMLLNPGSITMFQYYWNGSGKLYRFNSESDLQNLTQLNETDYVLIPSDPIPKENIEGWKIYSWLSEHANKTVNYRGMDVYKVTNI